MDNSASAQSILDTLRTVEFRLGLKGYNVDEVDEYLEKAAAEAESVQEQLRTATERLRLAGERIGQLEAEIQRMPADRLDPADPAAPSSALEVAVSDDTLQRTLVLAQKFVDQTKRESEAEAAEVVGKAESRAHALVAQAEEHARRLVSEADQRLRDEVGRLESTRTRLAGEVDVMSKHLEEQRARIRQSLTDALKWIDERVQPDPAQAPPAVGEPATSERGQTAGRAPASGSDQGAHGKPASQPAESTAPTQALPSISAALPATTGPGTQVLPVAAEPERTPPPAVRPGTNGSGGTGETASLFENGRRTD